jgi:hypothetical protein
MRSIVARRSGLEKATGSAKARDPRLRRSLAGGFDRLGSHGCRRGNLPRQGVVVTTTN